MMESDVHRKLIRNLKNVFTDGFNFKNISISTVNYKKNDFEELQCLQYSTDVILNNIQFHMSYITPTSKPMIKPYKLLFRMKEQYMQDEIASCTNYLQRKRNLDLAFSILRKYTALADDRNLVLRDIVTVYKQNVSVKPHEDGGCMIESVHHDYDFKFFSCNWKIDWSCYQLHVLDSLEFWLNCKDRKFYCDVKALMQALTDPTISIEIKFQKWHAIMQSVNRAIDRNLFSHFVVKQPVDLTSSHVEFITVDLCKSSDLSETLESDDSIEILDITDELGFSTKDNEILPIVIDD